MCIIKGCLGNAFVERDICEMRICRFVENGGIVKILTCFGNDIREFFFLTLFHKR